MKKVFTTLNTRIEEIEHEDSDLTNLDEDNKEKWHFSFEESEWFQGVYQTT